MQRPYTSTSTTLECFTSTSLGPLWSRSSWWVWWASWSSWSPWSPWRRGRGWRMWCVTRRERRRGEESRGSELSYGIRRGARCEVRGARMDMDMDGRASERCCCCCCCGVVVEPCALPACLMGCGSVNEAARTCLDMPRHASRVIRPRLTLNPCQSMSIHVNPLMHSLRSSHWLIRLQAASASVRECIRQYPPRSMASFQTHAPPLPRHSPPRADK